MQDGERDRAQSSGQRGLLKEGTRRGALPHQSLPMGCTATAQGEDWAGDRRGTKATASLQEINLEECGVARDTQRKNNLLQVRADILTDLVIPFSYYVDIPAFLLLKINSQSDYNLWPTAGCKGREFFLDK